jgi:hypothetical protein
LTVTLSSSLFVKWSLSVFLSGNLHIIHYTCERPFCFPYLRTIQSCQRETTKIGKVIVKVYTYFGKVESNDVNSEALNVSSNTIHWAVISQINAWWIYFVAWAVFVAWIVNLQECRCRNCCCTNSWMHFVRQIFQYVRLTLYKKENKQMFWLSVKSCSYKYHFMLICWNTINSIQESSPAKINI